MPIQETKEICVRSLGQEEPLEEGMATHSSILAWRIPWTEEPHAWATVRGGRKESDATEATYTCMHTLQRGESQRERERGQWDIYALK